MYFGCHDFHYLVNNDLVWLNNKGYHETNFAKTKKKNLKNKNFKSSMCSYLEI